MFSDAIYNFTNCYYWICVHWTQVKLSDLFGIIPIWDRINVIRDWDLILGRVTWVENYRLIFGLSGFALFKFLCFNSLLFPPPFRFTAVGRKNSQNNYCKVLLTWFIFSFIFQITFWCSQISYSFSIILICKFTKSNMIMFRLVDFNFQF